MSLAKSFLIIGLVVVLAGACSLDKKSHTGTCVAPSETKESLGERIVKDLSEQRVRISEFNKKLYGDGAVKIASDSGLAALAPTYAWSGAYLPFIGSANHTFAAAWDRKGCRHAVISHWVMRDLGEGQNLEFEAPFFRLLVWLMGLKTDESVDGITKVIALFEMSDGDVEEYTAWLADHFPGTTIRDCRGVYDCFAGVDLIVVAPQNGAAPGDESGIAVAAALDEGKPVLVTGGNIDVYAEMLGFEITQKLSPSDSAADYSVEWPSAGEQVKAMFSQTGAPLVSELMERFKDNTFSIDWSLCAEDDDCADHPDITTQVSDAADLVRERLGRLVNVDETLFEVDERRGSVLRELVWLGDLMRREIQYPVSRTDEEIVFASAYFADRSVYDVRDCNPAQPDLGDFSRGDLSYITGASRTIRYERGADYFGKTFFPAKVYALPGQTFTVTRLDQNQAGMGVFVNSVRAGSTKDLATENNRPKFLRSFTATLNGGESRSFTSAYGGPIQIVPPNPSEDEVGSFEVRFDNIGEHPVWDGPDSTEEFMEDFERNEYDWVEFVTPGFVVHSQRSKFVNTLEDEKHTTMDRLAELAWRYEHQDIRNLAGNQGEGLGLSDTLAAFCDDHGWDCEGDIHTFDAIQHANFDRATCGYGCSGNPFDTYGAFGSTGWINGHEIGHNIQRNVPCMNGACAETFNNVYPLHVLHSYARDELGEYYARPHQGAYELIQEAACSGSQMDAALGLIWADETPVKTRLIFYHQVAVTNSDVLHLGDGGWDVYPLMAILRRILKKVATVDDGMWAQHKDALGFSLYSLDEARQLEGDWANDAGLVALSFITKRDQRPLFEVWGVPYSDLASSQVESFDYAPAQRRYLASDINNSDYPPLPVDCTTVWPFEESEK